MLIKYNKWNVIESFPSLIKISASGTSYSTHPPPYRSGSNSATLRFTSDDSVTQTGILMAYVLGKYVHIWLI